MNDLTLTSSKFNNIITRAGDVNALTFKTIDEKALVEINEWMPEVNRAVTCFNKQNSQTTASLMQLNMIDSGPYRVLRQILAQAEKKRMALNETVYKLELKKLEYAELTNKQEEACINIEQKRFELKQSKIGCDIIDAQGHIEAALKELGALKRRYEEVCKNNNIPEKWDEEDFEEAEIEHHIKSMFRNAIRDKMQGSCNMGTMEYFSQFGINSVVAYQLVDTYLNSIKEMVNNGLVEGRLPTIETEYIFYDRMYELFKDEYKRSMKRIGLDSITQADFLMKENK